LSGLRRIPIKSAAEISGLVYPKLSIATWFSVILAVLLLPSAVEAQTCPPEFTWEWSNPLPQGNRLHDVAGVGGEYAAVGTVGAAPVDAHVTLGIYEVNGKLVKTLIDGKQTASPVRMEWDGTDATGEFVASRACRWREIYCRRNWC
jgi:hypothetical protein